MAVIAGETYSPYLAIKGYYAPEEWDVYWTGRQACLLPQQPIKQSFLMVNSFELHKLQAIDYILR